MGWIKSGWRGEKSLAKIFWIYGVVLPFVVGLVYGFVVGFIDEYTRVGAGSDASMQSFVPISNIIFSLLTIVYGVWWMVATWRSATNAPRKIWGVLAKIVVLLSVLAGIFAAVFVVMDTMNSTVPVIQSQIPPRPVEAPAQAPAIAAPVDYRAVCEQQMRDHAIQNKVNPEEYIANNQPYIIECVNYWSKKTPQGEPR